MILKKLTEYYRLKLFIKTKLFIIVFFIIIVFSDIYGKSSKLAWTLSLDLKVTGKFNIKKKNIRGEYNFNIILNDTVDLDEDNDFVCYYKKHQIKDFLIYLTVNKEEFNIRDKKLLSSNIDFIIKKERDTYIEFSTKKIPVKIKGVNFSLTAPMSYGILNRKENRKYRKKLIGSSNKICLKSKLIFSKLNINKNYFWNWKKNAGCLEESHRVEINLKIKRRE